MSSFSWLWNVQRPAVAPSPPMYTLGVARPGPAEPFDAVEDAVQAIDSILRRASGRPKVWRRVDALLDQRNGLRAPRPLSVPVIPGRSS